MLKDGIYVAEYSLKQKCFNIDCLQRVMENNLMGILSKRTVDYIPFTVGTYEQCDIACNILRERLEN